MSMRKVKNIIIFALSAILFTGCNQNNTVKVKTPSSSAVSSKDKTSTEPKSEATDTASSNQGAQTVETSGDNKGFIFPNSDKKVIKDEELDHYDRFTLSLAKNELFARRGYKFKDNTLLNYFNNTNWYKPSDNIKGDYADLNDIEKKNFDLINLRYGSINSDYISNADHSDTIKKDINFDGQDETISSKFTTENHYIKYNISVTSLGKTYSISGDCGISVTPKLYFADFSLKVNYIDFYINYYVENDYAYTTIFRFDGNEIKKLIDIQGHIEAYDGNNNIYSELNRTTDKNKILISYYELGKGVVYPSKNDIIDKYLQYEDKLLLFKDVKDKTGKGSAYMSYLASDDSNWKKLYSSDQVIVESNPNEKLKILDIDYETYNINSTEKLVKNIPIKVQTEDGKIGWLVWMNGGA
jgi:hypothetical protein